MSNYSETPDIISISSHQKIEVLNPAEIESLKNGTLQLLAEVGVYFPSQKALTIFAEHGADVVLVHVLGPNPIPMAGPEVMVLPPNLDEQLREPGVEALVVPQAHVGGGGEARRGQQQAAQQALLPEPRSQGGAVHQDAHVQHE